MPAGAAPATRHHRRLGMVVACAVVLHTLALWGMQQALQRSLLRPMEVVLPMSVRLIMPSAPPAVARPVPQPVAPPMPQPVDPPIRKPAQPPKPVARRTPQAQPQPVPQTAPQAQFALEQEAPAASIDEPVTAATASAAPSSAPAGSSASPAVAATPAAAQPSSEAQCQGNPKPPYPALSQRRGETGQVVVDVLIGTDGRVQDVKLHSTSGYFRLDEAAQQAARHWRCQPVIRDGVPRAEWRNAPVEFVFQP